MVWWNKESQSTLFVLFNKYFNMRLNEILSLNVQWSVFQLLFGFTFSVQCCDVPYNFRIKTMFGSSLPPAACRSFLVLITVYVFASTQWVQHILCCIFVLFFFVLDPTCCRFLWIVLLWMPLRYSLTFN
jgi:hypothetical protein